jgi:hypothetical protein
VNEDLSATVARLDKEVAVLRAEQSAHSHMLDSQSVAINQLGQDVRGLSGYLHTQLTQMNRELSAHLLKTEAARTQMLWSAVLAGGGVFATLLFWVFENFQQVT